MSERNPDLVGLAADLQAARQAIYDAKEATEDPDVFAALNAQLPKIHHRVAAVNGLLFTRRAQEISDAAAGVEAARADLATAMKRIDDLNHAIRTVTAFLGVVDQAIAVAKRVALA